MEQAVEQKRKPRELETRETTYFRPESWSAPEALPMPNFRPGWGHRYCRISTLGTADPQNISSKLREGYEPVKADEYPELMMHAVVDGRFKGGIEIGGLILCRIPEEFLKQRNEYYAKQNKVQMESVDQSFMRESHPNMPKFSERRSEVSFGSGSK
jgi:hypothetical protein